jgi:hypothetical protein
LGVNDWGAFVLVVFLEPFNGRLIDVSMDVDIQVEPAFAPVK